jgi:hypothetical protein
MKQRKMPQFHGKLSQVKRVVCDRDESVVPPVNRRRDAQLVHENGNLHNQRWMCCTRKHSISSVNLTTHV